MGGTYAASGSYYGEFVTSNPTTGAAADATGTPTATATTNGTDDGAFTLTVAKIDTGRYKITGTVPSGYAVGDRVQISVSATVGGVAGKAVVDSFTVDATVSSRSTYAGADTAGTTTLLGRLTSTRADYLDYLDTAVSSRASQTSVDTVAGYVDTEVAAIKAKTDLIPASPASVSDIPTAAAIATAVHTTQMAESYNADGKAPTLAQAQFVMMQRLTEFGISGTGITVKKLDGATTAYTLTMDSASAPTSVTRAS
jgi:hypothetical protein